MDGPRRRSGKLGWGRAPVRPVRAPARAHRVLDARRCRAPARPVRRGRAPGHAGDRHDRSRQPLRGLRVLQGRHRARAQPDHRPRGLLRPPGPLRAPTLRLRRRLRRGQPGGHRRQRDLHGRARARQAELHAHDPVGREHRRHAQPLPPVIAVQPRGLLPQAALRPGAARAVRHGPDRHHRLPERRGQPVAAGRQLRPRAGGRRRHAGHPRRGQLLLRGHGPRARDRAPVPRGPAAHRPHPRPAPHRHERPALRARVRRRHARRPALHRHAHDDGRPEALPLRRPRLLRQVGRRDAPGLVRAARGVRQHAPDRRAVPRRVRRGRQPHARLPRARRGERGVLADQGGRGRPPAPLQGRRARRRPSPGRVRGRRHHPDGLPRVLPRDGRPRPPCEGERHPGRPGPRLGGRRDDRLRAGDHRARSHEARPAVRALPQPRAHLHARHRHGLRRAPPRRHDPLRHGEVRRGAGGADHHLRLHQGEGGDQGQLAGPGPPVRPRRPHHEGHAPGRHGQGRLAQGRLRPEELPVRRGRGVPRAVRGRGRRPAGGRHGEGPRGTQAPARRARGRGHPVPRAAARRHPGLAARAGRRRHHPVRHGCVRVARPPEDGLPRPAEPHRPGRLPAAHRVQPRRDDRARGARPRRPGHLRAPHPRRHPRGVPARRRADAGAAALHAARQLRGHLRGPRPVPARSHGRQRPQRLRGPQERPQAGRADPSRARRAARRHPGRHVRPDRVPGAGHGHRAEARGLLPRRRRPPAPGHGQEEEGDPRQGVRALQRGHEGQRLLRRGHQDPVGDPRPVLGLRVQQGAHGRLRTGVVLDRVPQGELPGGVHGRAADRRSRTTRTSRPCT